MNTSSNTVGTRHSHRAITMDFTTTSGKHLLVRVPLTLFDDVSLKIGNSYKANYWIVARCNEVERLSHETIEQYVNIMARQICQQGTMLRIEVQVA